MIPCWPLTIRWLAGGSWQPPPLKPPNYSLVGYILRGNNHAQPEAHASMMRPDGTTRDSLLPLSVPVFQILISLSETDLHGYAIIGDVRDRTRGEVVLSTSTLYGAIKRMMRDGLVTQSDLRPAPELDDERRQYYRITDFGRAVAAQEARRIERLAEMVRGREFQT